MAFESIRNLAASGPVIQPPAPLPPVGISPITPTPDPIAQTTARGSYRANRMREYLAANPNRRPSPMGRRADGSINYDASVYGQNYGASNAAPSGGQLSPGAFNGANPALQPYSAAQTPDDQYQFTAPRPRGFGGG